MHLVKSRKQSDKKTLTIKTTEVNVFDTQWVNAKVGESYQNQNLHSNTQRMSIHNINVCCLYS